MVIAMTILTQRIILTQLTKSDFNELIPLWTSEEVRKYLGGICSQEKAAEILQESIQATNEYNFTAKLKETGDTIGILMIAPHHDPKDTEISFMLFPKYWGMGYAAEALTALLDFCKETLKLKRVVSETQTANESSCRLLTKIGYKIEAELERFGAKQTIYAYDLMITDNLSKNMLLNL